MEQAGLRICCSQTTKDRFNRGEAHFMIIFLYLYKNSLLKKIGSHIMTMLYPNPCYKDVCYKGTALYFEKMTQS